MGPPGGAVALHIDKIERQLRSDAEAGPTPAEASGGAAFAHVTAVLGRGGDAALDDSLSMVRGAPSYAAGTLHARRAPRVGRTLGGPARPCTTRVTAATLSLRPGRARAQGPASMKRSSTFGPVGGMNITVKVGCGEMCGGGGARA